jgi:hypothetical protein
VAESELIPGTDRAQLPFWSPDGKAIAFFAGSELVRIDERGGSRQKLADVLFPRGGTWSQQGTILFSSNNLLQRAAEEGGPVTTISALDQSRDERMHAWPVFLPDGHRFLYLGLSRDQRRSAVFQGALDSTERRLITSGTTSFAVTGTQLLTLTNRSLTARTLDVTQMMLSGEPNELARGVGVDVRNTHAALTARSESVLAYRIVGDQSRLTWYDRHGRAMESVGEPGDYQHPWLSPDARSVVVEKTDPSTGGAQHHVTIA